ncbi:unnamed protein product [Ambrosiozyma monospora]|uniref:Unnamed protein product n=1 Tax=Ambrosiozyma monospora TaxID=43982 RepID=A0ACB5TBI1_AMBMO|nr:unnamed protein product [Ambrosiozyma monospora]
MTNSAPPTQLPPSTSSPVNVEFITLPISHFLKFNLEPQLISIINRGYNKPRFKYGVIDTARVKEDGGSLLKDFQIDEEIIDDTWFCLALATGTENGNGDEIKFDSSDSGSQLTKKLIQKYPIGSLNFQNLTNTTSTSIIAKSTQLLQQILSSTTPQELEFQILGTIAIKPHSPTTSQTYAITAFTSFYPSVSSLLFTHITQFAKQQLHVEKFWIDVIEEHDLVGFYEKLGFVFIERVTCKVDPVTKALVGEDGGLEGGIRANCDFHLVLMYKDL